MTRRFSALLVLLLLAVGFVVWYRAQGSGDHTPIVRPNLVVITGGSSPYWQSIGNGARAAAKDLNVTVDVRMPKQDEDVDAQWQLLLGIDPEKIDGAAISPLDADLQTRAINELAGDTLVVTIDSDAPLSNRLSYVGASNVAAGRQCANLVREAVPGGGKIVVLLANLTKSNTLERKEGFEETLTQISPGQIEPVPNIEVVEYLVDEGDNARCEQQLRNLLAAHGDLVCLVGMNAYHGPILLKVLRDEGRLGKMKLVTFDTVDETLAGIEAGEIYATVAQDPYEYGYEAVRLLSSYCRRWDQRNLPPPGVKSTMTINTNAVRKDNIDEFRRNFSGRAEDNTDGSKSSSAKKQAETQQSQALQPMDRLRTIASAYPPRL